MTLTQAIRVAIWLGATCQSQRSWTLRRTIPSPAPTRKCCLQFLCCEIKPVFDRMTETWCRRQKMGWGCWAVPWGLLCTQCMGLLCNWPMLLLQGCCIPCFNKCKAAQLSVYPVHLVTQDKKNLERFSRKGPQHPRNPNNNLSVRVQGQSGQHSKTV